MPLVTLRSAIRNSGHVVAKTITFPNKHKLTLNYREITAYKAIIDDYISRLRLQSVQSSNGYMAKYEYASNSTTYEAGWGQISKVTLLNNAVDYCAPAADSCSYSQTWPSLTFGSNASPSELTVTDTLN